MKSFWKRPLEKERGVPALAPLVHINNNGESPRENSELPGEDNAPKSDPLQGKQVDVANADQVRYWSNYFGVTPAELRHAVSVVGPTARVVRAYLD